MSKRIYKTFTDGDSLLFATDICRCNGRLFVETLSIPREIGYWASIKELSANGWEVVDVSVKFNY